MIANSRDHGASPERILTPLGRRETDKLSLVVIVVLVGGAIGAAIAAGAISLNLIILFAVLAGTGVLYQRTRFWELSPVVLLLVPYLAVALLAPLLAHGASEALGAGARITLSEQESMGTFMVFMSAAAGSVIGALIVSFTARPQVTVLKAIRDRPRRSHTVAILFAMTPALLAILIYRDALLDRPFYLLGETGSPFVIAAQVLPIPALVALGWLGKSCDSRAGRVLSYAGVIVYVVLLFSLGTRTLSLVPVLVAIGMLAADPSSKKSHVLVLIAALGSILLLQAPLTLRGSSEHGLVPYLATLFGQSSSGSGLDAAASNILFSYALTGAVAFHAHLVDWSSVLVSLDPRPGQFTDWYAIQPLLRLNAATPDNALGELASLGLWWVFSFFLAVGAFFGYLDRRIRRLLSDGRTFSALLLFALAAYFVLETLQYNLRSSTRVIYYLILADGTIRLSLRMWRRHRQAHVFVDWANLRRNSVPASLGRV